MLRITIQLSISHLFTQLNIKQFYFKQFSLARVQFSSIWPIDRTPSGTTTPIWVDQGAMAIKRYSVFPKLQHYRSFTIRLFCGISKALVRGVLPLSRDAVGVFYSHPLPADWAILFVGFFKKVFLDYHYSSL